MKDFILKDRFKWTQEQLENEYVDDLEAYLKIIDFIGQKAKGKDE